MGFDAYMKETDNKDFKFFESKLPGLIKEHKGQFVLIKDEKIHGFYLSVQEALQNGYTKFGNSDFLIQEVTDEKRVNYINSAFLGN